MPHPFAIAAGQSSSIKGDIAANVRRQGQFVRAAAEHGARVVVFPELSLTGYEPTVAAQCAIEAGDSRLRPFQELADSLNVIIMPGCAIRSAYDRPYIGMFVFQPRQAVAAYRKRFVHVSELPYFVASDDCVVFPVG